MYFPVVDVILMYVLFASRSDWFAELLVSAVTTLVLILRHSAEHYSNVNTNIYMLSQKNCTVMVIN